MFLFLKKKKQIALSGGLFFSGVHLELRILKSTLVVLITVKTIFVRIGIFCKIKCFQLICNFLGVDYYAMCGT